MPRRKLNRRDADAGVGAYVDFGSQKTKKGDSRFLRYKPGINVLQEDREKGRKIQPTPGRKAKLVKKYFINEIERLQGPISSENQITTAVARKAGKMEKKGTLPKGVTPGDVLQDPSFRKYVVEGFQAKIRAYRQIIAQSDAAAADASVQDDYLRRFHLFLRGKPIERDAQKMKTLGMKGKWDPLPYSDVQEYLRAFSRMRHDYYRDLAMMKMRGPGDNLLDIELYFKYLVDGEDKDKIEENLWAWLEGGNLGKKYSDAVDKIHVSMVPDTTPQGPPPAATPPPPPPSQEPEAMQEDEASQEITKELEEDKIALDDVGEVANSDEFIRQQYEAKWGNINSALAFGREIQAQLESGTRFSKEQYVKRNQLLKAARDQLSLYTDPQERAEYGNALAKMDEAFAHLTQLHKALKEDLDVTEETDAIAGEVPVTEQPAVTEKPPAEAPSPAPPSESLKEKITRAEREEAIRRAETAEAEKKHLQEEIGKHSQALKEKEAETNAAHEKVKASEAEKAKAIAEKDAALARYVNLKEQAEKKRKAYDEHRRKGIERNNQFEKSKREHAATMEAHAKALQEKERLLNEEKEANSLRAALEKSVTDRALTMSIEEIARANKETDAERARLDLAYQERKQEIAKADENLNLAFEAIRNKAGELNTAQANLVAHEQKLVARQQEIGKVEQNLGLVFNRLKEVEGHLTAKEQELVQRMSQAEQNYQIFVHELGRQQQENQKVEANIQLVVNEYSQLMQKEAHARRLLAEKEQEVNSLYTGLNQYEEKQRELLKENKQQRKEMNLQGEKKREKIKALRDELFHLEQDNVAMAEMMHGNSYE